MMKGDRILFIDKYFNEITNVIRNIYKIEKEKIDLAGKMTAKVLIDQGLIYVFGCGHSHMVCEEMFYRAGGLVPVNPIFEESVMLHSGAFKSSMIERMSGYARYVIEDYNVTNRDILIASSSSGINSFTIEMAEEAKKRGAQVIGISSSNYLDKPTHDINGRRLSDVTDILIDNHVPYGDAIVEIGNELKAGPISSFCSFFIVNAIALAAIEEITKKGVVPPVFVSGNIKGGDIYNKQILEKYRSRIKHL